MNFWVVSNKRWFIPLLLCVMLSLQGICGTPVSKPPIKVLIIDGYSNHDWQLTTKLIRAVLEPTGLFSVSVSTTPPTTESPGWDQWRPDFKYYDVVIQTCNNNRGGPSWPVQVQEDFEAYVREGGGVYIFHGGNNSFPEWKAYSDIIGLGWRNKNQGIAVTINSSEKLIIIPAGEGENTGHGERTDAIIHNIGNHPIHKGLPQQWKTANVEIYYYARGSAEQLQVLSYAFDEPTKMNWPIEWTVRYGKGRVFNSTFGHVWKGDTQPVTMRCAGVQTILIRAMQWLAKRNVSYAVPPDFPTEDKISVRGELTIK